MIFPSSRFSLSFFLVACALVAPACGQVVTPGGPSQAPPTNANLSMACQTESSSSTLVEACTAFIKRRDAYATTCGGFSDERFDEQAAIASCVGIATSPGALVTPAEIDGCATTICGGCGIELYPACVGYEGNLLFPGHDKKGTAPPGDPCVAHLQCASGYCSSYGIDCGHCENARSLGETCTGQFDKCEDEHAQCSSAGVCELTGQRLGEACTAYGQGDCQANLFCEVTDPSTTSGVCVARHEVGGSCIPTQEQCVDGLYCHDHACKAPLADGQACDGSYMCAQSCVDGKCGKPVIPLHAGDPCSHQFGCGHDLYCNDADHCAVGCSEDLSLCAPRPQSGSPCDMNGNCAPNTICVGFNPSQASAGVCTRKGGEGEACPCGDDLACVHGKCVAFGAATCE